MTKIMRLEVYLDDNVPEDMAGVYRIGSIIQYDENDKSIPCPKNLVNNKEFFGEYSDAEDEIRNYVAQELNVALDIVEVIK